MMYLCWTHSGTRYFAATTSIILGGTDIYFLNDSTPVFTGVTTVFAVATMREVLNWINDGTINGVS